MGSKGKGGGGNRGGDGDGSGDRGGGGCGRGDEDMWERSGTGAKIGGGAAAVITVANGAMTGA